MEIKERIKSKADELFRIYGIRSVTMDEIAAHLGISKKTIYQTYTDKDEIVNDVVEEHIQLCEQDCVSCHSDAENAIHEGFLAMDRLIGYLQEINPAMVYDLEKFHYTAFDKFISFKKDFLLKCIYDNLEQGITEGLFRPEINMEILASVRVESIYITFDPHKFNFSKYTLFDIHLELMVHFLYGLATPKGYKLIEKYYNERKTTNE